MCFMWQRETNVLVNFWKKVSKKQKSISQNNENVKRVKKMLENVDEN